MSLNCMINKTVKRDERRIPMDEKGPLYYIYATYLDQITNDEDEIIGEEIKTVAHFMNISDEEYDDNTPVNLREPVSLRLALAIRDAYIDHQPGIIKAWLVKRGTEGEIYVRYPS